MSDDLPQVDIDFRTDCVLEKSGLSRVGDSVEDILPFVSSCLSRRGVTKRSDGLPVMLGNFCLSMAETHLVNGGYLWASIDGFDSFEQWSLLSDPLSAAQTLRPLLTWLENSPVKIFRLCLPPIFLSDPQMKICCEGILQIV